MVSECQCADVSARATTLGMSCFSAFLAMHKQFDNAPDNNHKAATDNTCHGDDCIQSAIGQQCACQTESLRNKKIKPFADNFRHDGDAYPNAFKKQCQHNVCHKIHKKDKNKLDNRSYDRAMFFSRYRYCLWPPRRRMRLQTVRNSSCPPLVWYQNTRFLSNDCSISAVIQHFFALLQEKPDVRGTSDIRQKQILFTRARILPHRDI